MQNKKRFRVNLFRSSLDIWSTLIITDSLVQIQNGNVETAYLNMTDFRFGYAWNRTLIFHDYNQISKPD